MAELNLNDRAIGVADMMIEEADALGVSVHNVGGARVIDAGVEARGSLDAGLLIAQTCMADLATASIVPGQIGEKYNPQVTVSVPSPVAPNAGA